MAARRPLVAVSGRIKYLPAGDTIDFSLLSGKPTTLDGYGITDGLKLNDTVMNNNVFGGRRLYNATIDNALAAADKRYTVTVTTHLQTYLAESYPKLNPDWVASYSVSGSGTSFTITGAPTAIVVYNGTTICVASGSPTTQYQYTYSGGTLTFGATVSGTITAYPDHTVPQYLDSPVASTLSSATPFDGTYESYVTAPIGSYLKIRIQASADGNSSFPGYPYGSFFLSHYSNSTGAGTSQYRCYNRNLHVHTIGWKVASFTDFVGTTATSAYIQSVADELNFGRTIIEFIVHSHASRAASVTEVEWKLTRPAMGALPVVTNYGTNKLHYALTLGAATTTSVTISPTGLIDLNALAGEPRFRVANTALAAGVDFTLGSSGTIYGIYDRNGTPGWAMAVTASTRAVAFNGAITAPSFVGPLTGNATTATTLQTGRTIAISGPVTGTATSFNGSANITIPVTAVNLSDAAVTGTLAAARMPALTGDVTTTAGTVATTIANSAVTLAKMANMATASLLGRNTGGTGAPEVLSAATARSLLGLGTAALVNTGTSGTTIPLLDGANTWSGIQTISNNSSGVPILDLTGSSTNSTFMAIKNTAASGRAFALYSSGGGPAAAGTFGIYDLNASLNRLTINSSGLVEVMNTLRATGAVNPPSGSGIEFYYSSDRGYIISYDRSGAVWKDTRVYGANVELYASNTLIAAVSTAGVTVTGKVVSTGSGGPGGGASYGLQTSGSFGGGFRMLDGSVATAIWTQTGPTAMHFGIGDSTSLTSYMNLTATGLTLSGDVTVAGVLASAQNIAATTANLVLGAYNTGGGNVYLRPDGVGSSTGQVHVSTGGVGFSTPVTSSSTFSDSSGPLRAMPRTTGGLAPGNVFATSSNVTANTGAAAGSVYAVYNDSASAITLVQGGGVTLRLSGTASTGNRVIAARGMATFWCNSTTEYIVTGDVT